MRDSTIGASPRFSNALLNMRPGKTIAMLVGRRDIGGEHGSDQGGDDGSGGLRRFDDRRDQPLQHARLLDDAAEGKQAR